MNAEFIEQMAPPRKKTQPTLRQLEYQRRFNARNIEQEVLNLEKEFKECNKLEEPGRWLQLQSDLGEGYKKVMGLVKPPAGGV
jgi:hypothetical protein